MNTSTMYQRKKLGRNHTERLHTNIKKGTIIMLILKYERLDFFNHRIYTEDKKENYTRDNLKKVFAYFSKTHDASIQIDNVVVYWDCLSEYENRIVTVRNYDGMNYNESKKSFDKVKKECYAMA